MSTTHDIDDNDEPLFQFDPFDSHLSLVPSNPQLSLTFGMSPGWDLSTMSAHTACLPSDANNVGTTDINTKGKGRTMPMPIRQSTIVRDLFEISPQTLSSPMSYDSSSSALISSPSTSNFSSESNSLLHRRCSFLTEDMEQFHSSNSISDICTGKGKKKAPMLPPLAFTNIHFDYDQDIPPTPGRSSYGTSPTINDHGFPPSSAISVTDIPISSPLSPDAVVSGTRCQSLTDLSNQGFPLSIGSPSTSLASATFETPGAPSNLSRQLLEILDKKDLSSDSELPAIDPTSLIPTLDLQVIPNELDNHRPAWYTKTSDAKRSRSRELLKPKSRSRSPPYPISALDIIPDASTDVFQPLPIVIPNYFDLVLPKELQLCILRALVGLHEDDHQRSILEGRFTVAKATSSRGRWVGRDKGIRELFKLSRVSKYWQALIFDGQLWANLDLHSFPGLPQETITRIVRTSGSFIRSLAFAGHTSLAPDTMGDITLNLCLKSLPLSYNQLTFIDLQGCVSLTTRSLHRLLVQSRALTSLSLKGLNAVTNTTCNIISNFCPNLTSLNMSRCVNMNADGIRTLAHSALHRRDHLKLRVLRLSGLGYVSDKMMADLGQAAPFLEVLDLSYSRQLHNSAIDAFVACDEELPNQMPHVDTVLVAGRDLGREDSDFGAKILRRRITRLRHLILSHCIMLTDSACANLAHSVPKLEFLELAGIGPDLQDAGLVRLLQQTPYIRKLDLEDASEMTDAVIKTVTPVPEIQENPGTATPKSKQPGHILQHLNISYATNVSDDALLGLIRNCKYLTALEADNTRIGKSVLKEFVRISRQRRAINARIVTIDCRGINENLVKELSPMTRPRLGFRRYDARKLNYLDARDDNEDELKVGQDECDEERVVIKTFYSWQTVDAVKAIKDKRRKTTGRKMGSESSNGAASEVEGSGGGGGRRSGYTRWWTPGRRSRNSAATSGNVSPILPDVNGGDGCVLM